MSGKAPPTTLKAKKRGFGYVQDPKHAPYPSVMDNKALLTNKELKELEEFIEEIMQQEMHAINDELRPSSPK